MPSLSQLSSREANLLAAVANTFFPPDGPIPLSGVDAGIVPYFDRYLARSQPTQRFLMRLLFVFLDMSPLVFGPRRTRFTRLSAAEREQMMESASKSGIYFRRVTFISIRALMTMAYLANDAVARAMTMLPNVDPFGMSPSGTPSPSPRGAFGLEATT
ncbi:MAG: hypothetical protein R3B72_29505 [Polyangiaceae bacterium]